MYQLEHRACDKGGYVKRSPDTNISLLYSKIVVDGIQVESFVW